MFRLDLDSQVGEAQTECSGSEVAYQQLCFAILCTTLSNVIWSSFCDLPITFPAIQKFFSHSSEIKRLFGKLGKHEKKSNVLSALAHCQR